MRYAPNDALEGARKENGCEEKYHGQEEAAGNQEVDGGNRSGRSIESLMHFDEKGMRWPKAVSS